jgi:Tudor domain
MCLYVYDVEGGPLQIPGMTRINLNEELVSMGLAYHCSNPLLSPKHAHKIQTWKSPEPRQLDSVFWGIVTWVNLTGEIFLHDVKSKKELAEITKWLNDAYNDTEPSPADLNCRPGDICIAKYVRRKTIYDCIPRLPVHVLFYI